MDSEGVVHGVSGRVSVISQGAESRHYLDIRVIIDGAGQLSRVQSGEGSLACREELAMSAAPELLFDGPADAATTIALAHGAGAGMDSPFMDFFAKSLGQHGFRIVRFEYPYMASQRSTGKRSRQTGSRCCGRRGGASSRCLGKKVWSLALTAF